MGGGGSPAPTPVAPPPPPPPPEVAPLMIGADNQKTDNENSSIAKKRVGKSKLQVPLGASGSSTGLGVPTP